MSLGYCILKNAQIHDSTCVHGAPPHGWFFSIHPGWFDFKRIVTSFAIEKL
jgi:hypothetical protein